MGGRYGKVRAGKDKLYLMVFVELDDGPPNYGYDENDVPSPVAIAWEHGGLESFITARVVGGGVLLDDDCGEWIPLSRVHSIWIGLDPRFVNGGGDGGDGGGGGPVQVNTGGGAFHESQARARFSEGLRGGSRARRRLGSGWGGGGSRVRVRS